MEPVYARIIKVDERNQTVTGRAVQQMVDRDNECFHYDSSVPNFKTWSAEVFADTEGKSLGNVRAMHGNTCAGKLTDIQYLDSEKAIDITAQIVDPVEWKKVESGCYSGFSIGGRYSKKWTEIVNGKPVVMYTAVPIEISVVDRPCVSASKFHSISKFDLIKRDGSIVKREFVNTHELALVDGKIALVKKADLTKLAPGEEPSKSDRENSYNQLAQSGASAALDSAKAGGSKDGAQLSQVAKNATDNATSGKLSKQDYLTRSKAHYAAACAHTKASGYHMALDDIITAHAHHGACEAHHGAAEYIMTSNLPQAAEKFDDGDLEKGGPGSGRHSGGGSMSQEDHINAARDHAAKAKAAFDSGTRKGKWDAAAHDTAAGAHYKAAESIRSGKDSAAEDSADAQSASDFANKRTSK